MSTDRNVLLGILALEMNLVSRDALVEAMKAWVVEQSSSLGEILVKHDAIDSERRESLEQLVDRHVEQHGGDCAKSLGSVSTPQSVTAELARTCPELTASLQNLSTTYSSRELNGAASEESGEFATHRYRVLHSFARGGLGKVSVALDQELKRKVALKEILEHHADNPQSRSRFTMEAEITGNLEHPNIVPVYGLGRYSDGRPYYAMRLIHGESLSETIREFHASTYPDITTWSVQLRRLLGHFTDVCNAIDYAHSKGVLHRDLKPENIILGEYGETLVLDWGLAKLINSPADSSGGVELLSDQGSSAQKTLSGSIIGTPVYMSPEQADGRIDDMGPASDVYSLGATLYSLLTGRTPFKGSSETEILEQVKSGSFPRPRSVRPQTPAGLEAICLRTMEHSPKHRYQTASDLADDIERWLADEPVSAWREPVSTTVWRWIRKHKGLVATTSVAVLLTVAFLTFGVAVLAYKNDELTTARDNEKSAHQLAELRRQRAVQESENTQAINDFLVHDMLLAATPEVALGADTSLEQVLANASERVETRFLNRPALETAVRSTLGEAFHKLGRYKEAEQQHRKALELLSRAEQSSSTELLATVGNLALSLKYQGKLDEAQSLYEQTLEQLRVVTDEDLAVSLTVKNNLAVLLEVRGELTNAEELIREVIDGRKKFLAEDDPELVLSWNNLGLIRQRKSELDDAARIFQTARQTANEGLGERHPVTLLLTLNYGRVLYEQNKHEQAREILAAVLEQSRQVLGDEHSQTAATLFNLAAVLVELNGLPQARSLLLEAMNTQRQSLSVAHPHTLGTMRKLVSVLSRLGHLGEAEELAEETRQGLVLNRGEQDQRSREMGQELARLRLMLGKFAEAEQILRALLATESQVNGAGHPATIITKHQLAFAMKGQAKIAEAEATYREVLEEASATFGPEDMRTLTTQHNLGVLIAQSGRPAEGEEQIRAVLEIRRRNLPQDHLEIAHSLNSLGTILCDQERYTEAEALLEEAVRIRQKKLYAGHAEIADVLVPLGKAMVHNGKADEAESILREGIEIYRNTLPKDDWLIAQSENVLGLCLAGKGNFVDSEKMMLDTYKRMKDNPLTPPIRMSQATSRIIRMYEMAGDQVKASVWRELQEIR